MEVLSRRFLLLLVSLDRFLKKDKQPKMPYGSTVESMPENGSLLLSACGS